MLKFALEDSPFRDEYLAEEVGFYALPEGYKHNGVEVQIKQIEGVRCDDYLNKNFRTQSAPFPILIVDGRIWMSLSFMELQSSFMPVTLMGGNVATGGLGLGYFTLKAMANSAVDHLDVYEQDPRVIKFFTETFRYREGFDKVTLIEGDARRLLQGKEYDFAFIDIYPSLLGAEIIDDILLFGQGNQIECLFFWGVEKAVLDAVTAEIIGMDEIPYMFRMYYALWMRTNNYHKMYQPIGDEEHLQQIIDALNEIGFFQSIG